MNLPCVSDYRPGDENLPGSPAFEPDDEFDERWVAITLAREALSSAEAELEKGHYGQCDARIAEAMEHLVPA